MTREQLIASLTATAADSQNLALDDDRYFDWSTEREGAVVMEVSDGVDTAQVEMTRDQIVSLQQRLTAYLLATA
jgi:hypothetical protein